MKKRGLAIIMALAMMFGVVANAAYFVDISDESVVLQIDNTKALVRGAEITLDVAPVIIDGRTMLPVRFVAEQAAGGTVKWDEASRTVEITAEEAVVTVVIDSPEMIVNGKTVVMDVPACIKEGRTLLPLRYIVEAVGKYVYWDAHNKIAMINDHPFPDMTEEIKITVAKLNGTYVPPVVEEEDEEPSAGVPADKDKVYTVLYEEGFDGEEAASPGTLQQPEHTKIESGYLNMNASPNTWSAFYPRKNWNFMRYDEFKCTIEAECVKESPVGYSSLFVGVRAKSYDKIATENGIFWVAFNDTNRAYIYAGDHVMEGTPWTNHTCEVELEKGISEKSVIQVVDTVNEITYYVDGAVVCRVAIEDEELKIYDRNNSLITTAENNLSSGVAFKTFSHLAASKLHSMKIEGVAKETK